MIARLLNTTSFKLHDGSSVPKSSAGQPLYAIFSHRWLQDRDGGEIELSDFSTPGKKGTVHIFESMDYHTRAQKRQSETKIREACRAAAEHEQRHQYIWLDTVCIDKSSSEELARSLNSMFQWYEEAKTCVTYLHDVSSLLPGTKMFLKESWDGSFSEWFDRGWTLQELLAPRDMMFYDSQWRPMGTKEDLAHDLQEPVRMSETRLNGQRTFQQASVAEKMSWMAGRATTEVEDIAYSLLGIFDLHMTPLKGEKKKAFYRLQEMLLTSTAMDESLFAWTIQDLKCIGVDSWWPESSRWGLLSPSPDCFKDSGKIFSHLLRERTGGGFRKTSQGLYFELPEGEMRQAIGGGYKTKLSLQLNCAQQNEKGKIEAVVIHLKKLPGSELWMREKCEAFEWKPNPKSLSRLKAGGHRIGRGSVSLTVIQPPQP